MRRSRELLALVLALISVAIGVAYVAYLEATPFPPDIARVVPALWLVVCIAAIVLAVQALKRSREAVLAWGALALSVVSALFGLVFLSGALLGD